MKKSAPFRFKSFSVAHLKSALKVGVDGTLLGAWTNVGNHGNVLDVGTGCGLIALMLAQRSSGVSIYGIDIHLPSVEEARENFRNSPWSDRLNALQIDFLSFEEEEGGSLANLPSSFDLIVSNPPFFDSGVKETSDPRLAARHQSSLPLTRLISGASKLLNQGGSLAMILPSQFEEAIIAIGKDNGLYPLRLTRVKGHPSAATKRLLIQMNKLSESDSVIPTPTIDDLILENSPGEPTPQYRSLCKDFYLKF